MLWVTTATIAGGADTNASASSVAQLGWSAAGLERVESKALEIGAAATMIVTAGTPVLIHGDVETPYRAHSIRKSMLDAMLGVAVAQGLIDLNRTIGSYEFAGREALNTLERRATLEQLATSRSGIYLPAASEVTSMRKRRPARGAHEPGEFFYYNNWNFNVLGVLLEQQAGQSIFDLFDQWIAKPAGLRGVQ